jgi:cytochrome c oxidase subunit 3
MEYYEALFTITDSIYGTTFFMLTGLHGLHVLVGAIFLLIYFLRIFIGTINIRHHKGFLFAI